MMSIPVIHKFIISYNDNYISTSSELILIIFSGNNQIIFGNKHLHVKKNYIFIIPPNIDFSFKGDGEVYMCIIPEIILRQIFGRTFTTNIQHFISDNCFSIFDIKNCPTKFLSIFKNIENELKNTSLNYKDITWLHIVEILFLLERVEKLTPKQIDELKTNSYIWSIKDVVDYIKNNFDSQFTLNELAEKCALNPSYFSRSFKIEAGIPLFEYINRLRVEKSCHLLKTSSVSIIDIAFSVGYNNVSFFNRYFKKIMNLSPGEYRNRIKR